MTEIASPRARPHARSLPHRQGTVRGRSPLARHLLTTAVATMWTAACTLGNSDEPAQPAAASRSARQSANSVSASALAAPRPSQARSAQASAVLVPRGERGRGWSAIAPPPLSCGARYSVAVWTGTEALFLGAEVPTPDPPCLAGATAASRSNGRSSVAFNPDTEQWRTLTPPPLEPRVFSHLTAGAVVVGTRVYTFAGMRDKQDPTALLEYDTVTGQWHTHVAPPPDALDSPYLVQMGDTVAVVSTHNMRAGPAEPPPAADISQPEFFPANGPSVDQVFEPRSKSWEPLPPDPFGPSAHGSSSLRSAVWTPHGLFVAFALQASDGTSMGVGAALLRRGQWRRLQTAPQETYTPWWWTGRRVVSAREDNDGPLSTAGAYTLPAGTWRPLRKAPPEPPNVFTPQGRQQWYLNAYGPRWAVIGGWLFDDAAESWTSLPRPIGAPFDVGASIWAGDQLIVLAAFGPWSPSAAWVFRP